MRQQKNNFGDYCNVLHPEGEEKSLLVTQLTKDITDTEMRLTASGANEEQQREERIDQKLLEDQKEKLTNIEK